MAASEAATNPGETPEILTWDSRLDIRCTIAVNRLSSYRGELTIQDGEKLLHRQEVGRCTTRYSGLTSTMSRASRRLRSGPSTA
jgi:hypothetical protein